MSDSVRMYRLICLKRSEFAATIDYEYTSEWFRASKLVYWRDNRAGYTDDVNEAGLYFLHELEDCGGKHGDWLIDPVWQVVSP